MIGKRKRESAVTHRLESLDEVQSSATGTDIFRKYFESRFEPLGGEEAPTLSLIEQPTGSETDGTTGSEWSGLSDEDEPDLPVQVVVHSKPDDGDAKASRSAEFRSFMSSKVPKDVMPQTSAAMSGEAAEEDLSETLNLKHDLDLQRLLKESHLLQKAKSSQSLEDHRHRATDSRIQSLGSKASLFQQASMPLSHRKGISAKAASRDASRRDEARETGIILEKAVRSPKGPSTRRDRGVDVPSVGRFRDGALRLSQKDVSSIQGQTSAGRKRGSKR